jgi:probable phosphoglycerate mutase
VTILALIRHGSTAWNEQGRMQGRRDIPLSEHGRAQVRAWHVPDELTGPGSDARWFSSPLARAVETAELICGTEPARDSALTEMDWGGWEGYSIDEIRARFGAEFARNQALGLDFRPPGGESPRDVLERVRSWLPRIAADGAPVAAVTHLGVVRAVLSAATGWDMTTKPPIRLQSETLHRFRVDRDGTVSIVECNVPLAARPVGDAL